MFELGVTAGWSVLVYDMSEDLGVAHDDRSTSGLSAGEQEGDRPSRTRSVYLALSKRNFDIPRRSLAEVVHIHDVVRQEFALLHVVRVVSDLAVLCSLLWYRVKKMAKRRERRRSGASSVRRLSF